MTVKSSAEMEKFSMGLALTTAVAGVAVVAFAAIILLLMMVRL